jgi:hypothetical protein
MADWPNHRLFVLLPYHISIRTQVESATFRCFLIYMQQDMSHAEFSRSHLG